jgi:hypothetical protein
MTGPTQNQSNSEYGFLEGWALDQFRSKQKSLLSQDENPRIGTIAVALEHRWSQNPVRTAIFRRHQVQGLQITRLVETTATIDSKVGESFGDRQNSPTLMKQSAFAESSSRCDGILSRILKGHAFGSLATKEECLGV